MKDARTKKILWRKFIKKKETLSDYQEDINWLENHHFKKERPRGKPQGIKFIKTVSTVHYRPFYIEKV